MSPNSPKRPAADLQLVQIVEAAFAEAARKSGEHLVCRPGCTQCCIGAFAINQLDAVRLREGLEKLDGSDQARAERVKERARIYVKKYKSKFSGNPRSGVLGTRAADIRRFEDFANDEPCPALDPETGLCDLYEHRPMTCRVFGPPVRTGEVGALGVCELCFTNASVEEIANCEMVPDPDGLEDQILKRFEQESKVSGETIVAFCLAR